MNEGVDLNEREVPDEEGEVWLLDTVENHSLLDVSVLYFRLEFGMIQTHRHRHLHLHYALCWWSFSTCSDEKWILKCWFWWCWQ